MISAWLSLLEQLVMAPLDMGEVVG